MVSRSPIGLLAAFAGLILLTSSAGAAEAPPVPNEVQVAAATLHEIVFKIDVNGGDYVTAKEVTLSIEPTAATTTRKPRPR